LLLAAKFGKCQTRICKHILGEELRKKGELLGLTVAFGHVPEAHRVRGDLERWQSG
jgi:hypothetical protein